MEKQELTDVLLVCMVLLTFEYAYAQDKNKMHFTAEEMFAQLSNFFNIEKDRVQAIMDEMCTGNILGKWEKKEKDTEESTIAYTVQSFKLRDGVVRVMDETPVIE
jgi:hypothetical protein